jgi:SAM-dependent methyltransferase
VSAIAEQGRVERELFARLISDAPFQPATNYWRAVEIAAVRADDLPPGRGLDLGCGDGRLTRLLLGHIGPRSMVGLDPDPLEAALAVEEGLYERVHTAFGDRIPEPDSTFDWVFSNSVLEHIPNLAPVLTEVARLLRADGRFVFTVPQETFHDCLRGPWLPWVSRRAYLDMIDQRCAHVRYWGISEWREALAIAKMDLVEARRYLSPRETRRWETLSRLTAGVLFAILGRRKRPIEMQRGLRLRGRRLNRTVAAGIASVLAPAPPGADQADGSCLLVIARRRSA